ncbi:hypothetical protein [Streptomyces shenzhenensis]|uniref:hypothetical protein n=1 Tax=Streptomyces shenzhenensis TaxID=943815 RepID=UPI001F2C54A9|nr:hypothetical protein [Streptomyces shenzhenensis]
MHGYPQEDQELEELSTEGLLKGVLHSADFKRCTVGEAVTRLRDIVGVTITDEE